VNRVILSGNFHKLFIYYYFAVSRKDQNFEATKLHFENLVKRYGSPIIILNLIKVGCCDYQETDCSICLCSCDLLSFKLLVYENGFMMWFFFIIIAVISFRHFFLGLRRGCCMFLTIMLMIGSRVKRSLGKPYFVLSLQMPSDLSIKVYPRRIA
jgi:hypothetical protein